MHRPEKAHRFCNNVEAALFGTGGQRDSAARRFRFRQYKYMDMAEL